MSTPPFGLVVLFCSVVFLFMLADGPRWVARKLVAIAVLQLPSEHRQRYREEWLFDIEARRNGVGALLWALGTCMVAHGIGRDLGAPAGGERLAQTLLAWLARSRAAGRRWLDLGFVLAVGLGTIVLLSVFGYALFVWMQRTFVGVGIAVFLAIAGFIITGVIALALPGEGRPSERRVGEERGTSRGRR